VNGLTVCFISVATASGFDMQSNMKKLMLKQIVAVHPVPSYGKSLMGCAPAGFEVRDWKTTACRKTIACIPARQSDTIRSLGSQLNGAAACVMLKSASLASPKMSLTAK